MKTLVFVVSTIFILAAGSSAQSLPQYGSNSAAGKYATVNDIRMYYETYGNGEPLLLLHGNGGSIQSFAYQIPELSKHFTVIAIDSRAQGRSTDSDKEITYALMASDVAALIEQLHLGSVYVVGWSDGGNIGLELALAHPHYVKRLITVGANYTHEHMMTDTARTVFMDANDPLILKTREMIRAYGESSEKLSPNPGRLPLIRTKLEQLTQRYPNITREQLKTISSPTLVVAGDHDLIRDEQTMELYHSLPHAQLCIVPGSSHLSLWEQPEFMNDRIVHFLQTPYRDIDRLYFFR